MSEHRTDRPQTEDFKIFLALGLPILIVSTTLIVLILNFGPGHGQ